MKFVSHGTCPETHYEMKLQCLVTKVKTPPSCKGKLSEDKKCRLYAKPGNRRHPHNTLATSPGPSTTSAKTRQPRWAPSEPRHIQNSPKPLFPFGCHHHTAPGAESCDFLREWGHDLVHVLPSELLSSPLAFSHPRDEKTPSSWAKAPSQTSDLWSQPG